MKTTKLYVFSAVCIAFLCFGLSSCTKSVKTVTQTDFAMGSAVTVKLYGYNEKNLDKLKVTSVIGAVDNALSKNNSASEVSKINALAGTNEAFEVDSKVYDYIKQTAEIYSLSGGRAAATSGALTELWGFDNDNFNLPSEADIKSAMVLCGDDKIVFDETNRTVALPAGYKLNLGSVGKGIACDEAVGYFSGMDMTGAVVSVGGSVATYGVPPTSVKWSVGVRNPFGGENEYFAILSLGNAFVSTSGDYEKKFTAENGETYFHILDLMTGYPVKTDLTSVTVIAETGLQSDALSTLCFILGKENSLDVLNEYDADAVFVYNDKTVFATDGIRDSLKITADGFVLV